MKNKITPPSCDWRSGKDVQKRASENTSRVFRHKGKYCWKGVKKERYKLDTGSWSDIVRQTLIGARGETTKFHLRYFEIAPEGYSSFEMHKHEHVVVVIRGKGTCVVGNRKYRLGYLDTLYISPNEPHQLRNPFEEPFGFFCVVNAKRDKPKILK